MKKQKPWEKDDGGTPKPGNNSAPVIDELKGVRDEIKKLEARDATLSKLLIEALGEGEHTGVKFKAKIKTGSSSRLDTKGLKEALPDEMIERFTKRTKPSTTITFKEIEGV